MGSKSKSKDLTASTNLDAARAPLLADDGPPPAPPGQRLTIDDMLRLHAGEFGRWQLRHFVLTCLAWALEAMHTMVMIFADRGGEADAAGGCPDPTAATGGGGGGSTVAEWGLVCGERYKVGLVQAGFFAGCMIGAGVFGHLSDSFLGRKGSLTIVCVLNTVLGLLTSLAPSYWAYAALRLLTGFSTGGVGLCAFVLATEPVGPGKRGAVGMSTFYFFSGGIALLSGVAYLFRPWRQLYAVSSLPSLLFLVAVLPFLSESPRWYLVRRRPDEAMSVMREIARTNGRRLPDGVSLKLLLLLLLGRESCGPVGVDPRRGQVADDAGAAGSDGGDQPAVLRGVLRHKPQRGEPQDQPLPERPAQLRRGDARVPADRGPAGPVRAEAAGRGDDVVQRGVLRGRVVRRGARADGGGPDGLRGHGDLRDGGHVQPAVHIHDGAVPDGGEERGAGVRDAGGPDGGDTGAAGGRARGGGAVCGLRSVRDRRGIARVLPPGDDEPAVVRHDGRDGGRRRRRRREEEVCGVIGW